MKFLFSLFKKLTPFGEWAAKLLSSDRWWMMKIMVAAMIVALVMMELYRRWSWLVGVPNPESTLGLVLVWTFLTLTTASAAVLAVAASIYLATKL